MRQRGATSKILQAVRDAFSLPDLRRRILITLGLLVAFRFIAHIPVPGVNVSSLQRLFEQNQLLGMLDLFSGGAMRNFSVAAMGVYPYITASIVMQLLVPVIPRLQALSQEGEAGRNRINQITHWLMVPLAALQGYGQLVLMKNAGAIGSLSPLGTVSIVIAMAAGTATLVWIGELITEYGIGNGVSIIIFGGIVAGLPEMLGRSLLARQNFLGLLVFAVIAVGIVAAIVIFTLAHRRIPVQYARSMFRGGRTYRQSGTTHIPIRVNTAGMIPLIFAMSLMILPGTIASYFSGGGGTLGKLASFVQNTFDTSQPLYWGLYFLLVLAFTFFYTAVIFQQMNLAQTLQRQGGFVPGIRPGQATAEYLNRVVMRVTWAGALFLAFIAITPFIAQQATGILVLQLSSTGLLIVVGVVLDTMRQLESQLLMRRYEGFIR